MKQTISYLAPKMCSLVPNAITSSKSLDVFKSKIKQWEPDCPCRLCKNYLQHVGLIQFSINYFFKSTPNAKYLICFEPMLLSCFCIFRILTPYVDISGKVTATGLELRTTQFVNEHHTILAKCWPNFGQLGQMVECSLTNYVVLGSSPVAVT